MLTIDTLSLHLPAGFAHRAERIARLLGDSLAAIDCSASVSMDRLALPALHIAPDASDRDIASQIADSVHQHLNVPRQGAR